MHAGEPIAWQDLESAAARAERTVSELVGGAGVRDAIERAMRSEPRLAPLSARNDAVTRLALVDEAASDLRVELLLVDGPWQCAPHVDAASCCLAILRGGFEQQWLGHGAATAREPLYVSVERPGCIYFFLAGLLHATRWQAGSIALVARPARAAAGCLADGAALAPDAFVAACRRALVELAS